MNKQCYKKGEDYFLNDDLLLDITDDRNLKLPIDCICEVLCYEAHVICEFGRISWWEGVLSLWSGLGSKQDYGFRLPCSLNNVPGLVRVLLKKNGDIAWLVEDAGRRLVT